MTSWKLFSVLICVVLFSSFCFGQVGFSDKPADMSSATVSLYELPMAVGDAPQVVPVASGEAAPVEAKKTISEAVGGSGTVKALLQFRRAGGNFRNLVQAAKNLKAAGVPVTGENLALEWVGNTATEQELGGFFDNFTLDDLIKLLELIIPFIMLFL